jgi:hypothetical protein
MTIYNPQALDLKINNGIKTSCFEAVKISTVLGSTSIYSIATKKIYFARFNILKVLPCDWSDYRRGFGLVTGLSGLFDTNRDYTS